MARKSKSQTEGSHALSSAPLSVEVHPAANIFPMMDDEQLASLADSIGRNGLRHKIVRWENGGNGVLIDGRNRFRACELAGVEPQYEVIEGDEDEVLAYIADMNLMRRDLKYDQKIMALAKIYPEPQKHKKKGMDEAIVQNLNNMAKSMGSLRARLSDARKVLGYEDLTLGVLSGAKPLYKAVEEAKQRLFNAQSDEAKLQELQNAAPDLYELVPAKLSLEEALSALEQRRKEEAERLKNMIHAARVAVTESVRHLQDMSREDIRSEYEALLENEAFLKQMEGIESANPDEIRAGVEFLIQIIHGIKERA